MFTRKRSRPLVLAGLLALGLLSGCGSSSTDNTSIPTAVTVFHQHGVFFRNNTTMTVGYNGFGQLGDGTLDSRATAQIVPGLGHMDGYAAGAAHTLVFTNNSSVMAWGLNDNGQLGVPNSTATTADDYSATPVRAGSLTHVTSVAAGAYHSLAVSDGNVYAWGYNGFGQLGGGTLTSASEPKQVVASTATSTEILAGTASFLTDAVQVAAGAYHSLALTKDLSDVRKVWAWGLNDFGQLGTSTTETSLSLVPVEVLFPGTTSKPKQIAAAGRYSVALMDDGTVWTWGYNEYGQLGSNANSTMGTRLPTATPTQVIFPGGLTPTITEISAGLMHVLARVDDGTVWGWGFNERGQLGNNPVTGDIDNSPNTAAPVRALKDGVPIPGVTKIQTFGDSSFATLTNGELWGWGDNRFGQLGVSTASGELSYRKLPVRVSGY